MAKTIKFNLVCDEKPVRTIEDLQNNFSIEDVLAYYDNKLLHRWLGVRGYNTELEAVSAITSSDPMEIIKELIRIFDVVTDEEKVEESIYMLKYLDEAVTKAADMGPNQYACYNFVPSMNKRIIIRSISLRITKPDIVSLWKESSKIQMTQL